MKAIRNNRFTFRAAAAIGLIASAASGMATPLFPGGTIALLGTTVGVHPNLAGLVIADTIRPFSVVVHGTTYTGHVQDRVVKEFATGTLDFYFRVVLDQQKLQAERMLFHRRSFPGGTAGPGITTDVEYRTDGLGIEGPSVASRTADGTWVTFLFNGLYIGQGSSGSTRFTYISTNAKSFNGEGWMFFKIDDSVYVKLKAYQPAL